MIVAEIACICILSSAMACDVFGSLLVSLCFCGILIGLGLLLLLGGFGLDFRVLLFVLFFLLLRVWSGG